jgi:hypothetical protein
MHAGRGTILVAAAEMKQQSYGLQAQREQERDTQHELQTFAFFPAPDCWIFVVNGSGPGMCRLSIHARNYLFLFE